MCYSVCPGRLLADASVFITIAMCLATFDIKPVVENGVPVIPKYKPEGGPVKYAFFSLSFVTEIHGLFPVGWSHSSVTSFPDLTSRQCQGF